MGKVSMRTEACDSLTTTGRQNPYASHTSYLCANLYYNSHRFINCKEKWKNYKDGEFERLIRKLSWCLSADICKTKKNP
jgi:hypothetical protein